VAARLHFSVNDLGNAVRPFLRELQPLLCANTDWELDLAGAGPRAYFGPTVAVVVASALLRARQIGHRAMVKLPTDPRELAAFCGFSGLRHLVDGGAISTPIENNHRENETSALHGHDRE
jgi:hypothetical protein